MSVGNGQGGVTNDGYGNIRSVKYKINGAHRVSWFIAFGDISEGLFVCHRCDNPSCVNPSHLFLGTQTDNMRDCLSKCRRTIMKGEFNGQHILTEKQVKEIRLIQGKTQEEIGKIYGVGQRNISSIRSGIRWKCCL